MYCMYVFVFIMLCVITHFENGPRGTSGQFFLRAYVELDFVQFFPPVLNVGAVLQVLHILCNNLKSQRYLSFLFRKSQFPPVKDLTWKSETPADQTENVEH